MSSEYGNLGGAVTIVLLLVLLIWVDRHRLHERRKHNRMYDRPRHWDEP